MNKYVVAFMSMLDGELKQEVVEANSALEAGLSYLGWWEDNDDIYEPPNSLNRLYEVAYDSDCYIHILDLSKALKTNRSGGLQTRITQFESESGFQQ